METYLRQLTRLSIEKKKYGHLRREGFRLVRSYCLLLLGLQYVLKRFSVKCATAWQCSQEKIYLPNLLSLPLTADFRHQCTEFTY